MSALPPKLVALWTPFPSISSLGQKGQGLLAESPKAHSHDAAKKLVADKCDFICALSKDSQLNGSAVKIANLLLFHYLSGKSGDAWPSEETLAKDIGVSERTARTAVQQLRKRRWFSVKGSKGKTSNRYRPNWNRIATRKESSGSDDPASPTRKESSSNPENSRHLTRKESSSNTFEESFEEPFDTRAGSFGPDEGATHQHASASEKKVASRDPVFTNEGANLGNIEAVEGPKCKQGDGVVDEREAIRATIRTAETERIKRNAAAERLNRFLMADHADKYLDLPRDEFTAALEAEMKGEGTGIEMLRECLEALS